MASYGELAALLRSARGHIPQSVLAARAGVSNKTISEYERGTFGLTGSPDAGVLYRLSAALNFEASPWFLAAGIEYNSEAAAQAIREVRARHGGDEQVISRPLGHAFRTLDEVRTAKTPCIRVGIVKSTPYYEAFDLRFAETICGLINHEWKCDVVHLDSVDEQLEALISITNRCHVVMGIMETLPRTSRGLRFIPYPGIEYRLNVVASAALPPLTWVDVQEKVKDVIVIVAKHDVGHEYVSALAGPSATNIVAVESRNVESLVRTFDDAVKTARGRPVIACTGEDVCCEILASSHQNDKYLLTAHDPSALRTLPTFRVGIYVRQDDTEWYELLHIAVDYAMRFAVVKIADIYADLFAQLIPIEDPDRHPYCFGRLSRMTGDSRQEFLNQLRRLMPAKCSRRMFDPSKYSAIADHVVRDALDDRILSHGRFIEEAMEKIETILRNLQTIGQEAVSATRRQARKRS